MAAFCLSTGVSPRDYPHLTIGQRLAFLTHVSRQQRG